jgi:hypothetical protein
MAKYRKRPLKVEAIKIVGVSGDHEDCEIAIEGDSRALWFQQALEKGVGEVGGLWVFHNRLCVGTLEGTMRADVGDFLVRGIAGEIYPVKPEVFEQTYEPISK